MYFLFLVCFTVEGCAFSLSSFDLADSWVEMSAGYVNAVLHISNSGLLSSYLLLVFFLYFFSEGGL